MERFEKIYEKYYRKIYWFLLKMSGSPSLAEELTQETLYRAFLHIDQYEGRGSVHSWLCGIARNSYLTEQKKQRLFVEPIKTWEPVDSMDLEAEAVDRQLRELMRREICQLPEPYGSVCILRIYGELTCAEIAAACGKSESWAKVTFFRGKTMLTERMEKYR